MRFSKKLLAIILILMLVFSSCNKLDNKVEEVPKIEKYFIENTKPENQMYIYGEIHGVDEILEAEFEYWQRYYNDGMRHLFIETPYYTSQYLNIWMQEDDNEILDFIFNSQKDTLGNTAANYEFFVKIKENCPETIFHGTDVGHQAHSIGQRYLRYLLDNDMYNTEEYFRTKECIDQGYKFYGQGEHDYHYREIMLTKNFISAYEKIKGENIMGIYGSAHVIPDRMDFYENFQSMGMKLKEKYNDDYHYIELNLMLKDIEPLRVDEVEIQGKNYKASYFGIDETKYNDIVSRKFWRIEDAYDDFKDNSTNGNVLPYNNYPMNIKLGEVFKVIILFDDGREIINYYRLDGKIWENMESTTEFLLSD